MILSFANHKGGTGKTTSAINIGKALCDAGKKILLIDLDPQGNLSYSLGLPDLELTVADFMTGDYSFNEVTFEVSGMHVLPSNTSLYSKITLLEKLPSPLLLLKEQLKKISGQYDFILIDCPPSMSLFTYNALNSAEGVIIPLVFEILSIQGLDQILTEINKIKNTSNASLKVIGVLGVIVNESRKLSAEVLQYIRDNYQVNVFNNRVRNNVKAAEAPSFGQSVIEYARTSISARDYINVTAELIKVLENQQQFITI